ncbi:type 4 prepilin-like proteins leader peptide-processing enzyme [Pseudorhodoferax aquiterrae]|uniref:Prepilin leader peptidase/N-methyltransferase n=1 Tax=Pseudorhodoferax aquiterrae TaxID=747304 RepID=A0ABQ3FVN9_9BURK|nr:A24 family peptidase [Pseudorhodoferax aquiterrae]GHC68778.1 type 4 prepilin-like proteins leader peptide-processing enzyme [Pseudorhodoferax aquiterrae]
MPAIAWLDAALGGVLGLLIGSFLNVVVYRVPAMMYRGWLRESADNLMAADPQMGVPTSLWDLVFGGKTAPPAHLYASAEAAGKALDTLTPLDLVRPRSRCRACGHQIRWYENLPVLSWLAQRGACSACGTRIGWRYPLVELATGALFGLCAWRWGLGPVAAAWALFAALLLCQFLIDLDTQLLPDQMNFLLLWAGLLASALGWTVPLSAAVWGAAAGYLVLWGFFHAYRLLTGREGMGYGDFKLLAALGAWLGADHLLAILLLSSIVGALLGGALLLRGRLAHKDVPIAFGPFLAGAGLLCLVLGPDQVRHIAPFAFPFG